MRQTGRNYFTSNSSSSLKWLIVLCLIKFSVAAPQYASPTYNSQYYGYNQPQLQPGVYPGASLTYTQQYPAAVQSIWSGTPIVVNDEANSLELQRQQQERQYAPINYYNNREADRFDANNNIGPTPARRAANHNYNNGPGYYYHTEQQERTQPSQQELEQRDFLAVADSRREDEQLVRIGGTRLLGQNNNYNNNYNNNNYYEPAQLLQRRNFEAKYARHFDDYLRKYPRRLQPLHNTGAAFVDK